MGNNLYIALINPALAFALASAFAILWLNRRQDVYLLWLVGGYCGSAIGFLLQHFTLPIGLPLTKLLSNASFVAAGTAIAVAILARYGRKVPWPALALLAAAGMSAWCWFMFVADSLNWRIYVINFTLGGVSLVVAAGLRPVCRNGTVEMTLFVLSLLSGLNFFARTVLTLHAHGPFMTYDALYQSVYWNTSVLSHALLSLMIALCLFSAAALDVFKALKADALTDPLSRLLNRRGFEETAGVFVSPDRAGPPLALVLADLDHFKTVNDRYGHEAGDRVIADFANRIRHAAGPRGVVARLGGEEFVVLLPASDLSVARLFAENVRASLAGNRIDGLPIGAGITASFGVALRMDGETLGEMMRRADDALYMAKKSGRDSVRISYQRPETAFPRAAG